MALKDNLKKIGQGLVGIADEAGEAIGRIHSDVQGRGGYVAVIRGKVEAARKSLEDKVFTNGEFDKNKAREILRDKAEATRRYGVKAVKVLGEVTGDVIDAASNRYRDMMPTSDELKTTYNGVGTQYEGILFRKHYEECLAFHAKADSKLPKNAKGRRQILNDIKASASGDTSDLLGFYKSNKDFADRFAVAEKYLS